MPTQWIKDVDTGELYPVQNDFEFETPAHLETPEFMTIDYDKTKEMTITELQNQLIAAQNHIEAIESEKTSDNNSAVTVNEVSPEIVSSPEKTSSHNISSFIVFSVLLGLGFLLILGLKVYMAENNIEISIPNMSEQQTVDYEITPVPENDSISNSEQSEPQERQETEQKQSDKEVLQNGIDYLVSRLLSMIAPLLTVLLSLFVVRFVVNFMRNSMY